MILQLMKSLYAHDVIDVLPLSVFWRLKFLERNKFQKQHMVPYEPFWHMDTTNCNLSKIGSKIIAIRFCEPWNRILKACIALKPEGDENWKPRNSINSDQLCLTSIRHFWKMYRKWKFPNFQIYGFYDFFLFKSMKSTKNPQNSILCTLWHNLYTKHR